MHAADTTPCLPWSEFSNKLFWGETSAYFVPRHYECQIASLLHLRGYGLTAARMILTWVDLFGSVECCKLVAEVDRADIERLLPEAPEVQWAKHNDFVWTVNEAV